MEKVTEDQEIFLFSKTSTSALFNPVPVSYVTVTGSHSQGENGRGMKLITHLHLETKLRMQGATTPLHHMPSWLAQGFHPYGAA
jgi:hypothetical protein